MAIGDTQVGRTSRIDAQRSRERILAAAGALLGDNPRATMAEVAAAAGLGRSTLHRHFRTRMDLVRALDADSGATEPEHIEETEAELPAGRLGRAAPLPLEAL